MNELFFLEKKDETRDFPLTTIKISFQRLFSLFLFLCVYFVLYVVFQPSHLPKFLVIIYSLFPLLVFFLAYQLFTKESPLNMYKRISLNDLKIGVAFFLLQIIYITIVSPIIGKGATNEFVGILSKASPTLINYSLIALSEIGDLMIEEVFSIMLFIVLLKLLRQRLKRSTAIGLALVLSSLVFGLMHFEAYNWHLLQMIVLIGGERLFLTGAYIRTKNLWVPFLIHYIFDMLIFSFSLFLGL
ncbi:CPBP family glutamic-type intramembrane protease [Enterococcus faecalis]